MVHSLLTLKNEMKSNTLQKRSYFILFCRLFGLVWFSFTKLMYTDKTLLLENFLYPNKRIDIGIILSVKALTTSDSFRNGFHPQCNFFLRMCTYIDLVAHSHRVPEPLLCNLLCRNIQGTPLLLKSIEPNVQKLVQTLAKLFAET